MATDALNISQQLLTDVRYGIDVMPLLESLENIPATELAATLDTDEKRKAFWINIYNSSVQYALKENKERYQHKWSFYGNKIIAIAGEQLSPNEIEHGILRRSQWIYGLGYVAKWFPGAFEKTMRVGKFDPRIHFALNCGAHSCPPILFYDSKNIHKQLENATKSFLQNSTRIENNHLLISKLFLYYRGDFGSREEVLKLLTKYEALPNKSFSKVRYDQYNWTLSLNNFG
jgi:hypothetical protein